MRIFQIIFDDLKCLTTDPDTRDLEQARSDEEDADTTVDVDHLLLIVVRCHPIGRWISSLQRTLELLKLEISHFDEAKTLFCFLFFCSKTS